MNNKKTIKNFKDQIYNKKSHVARPLNQKNYYDKNGILLSAMDDKDANRVDKLLLNNHLIDNIKSGHDIHAEKPEIFIRAIDDLQKRCK